MIGASRAPLEVALAAPPRNRSGPRVRDCGGNRRWRSWVSMTPSPTVSQKSAKRTRAIWKACQHASRRQRCPSRYGPRASLYASPVRRGDQQPPRTHRAAVHGYPRLHDKAAWMLLMLRLIEALAMTRRRIPHVAFWPERVISNPARRPQAEPSRASADRSSCSPAEP